MIATVESTATQLISLSGSNYRRKGKQLPSKRKIIEKENLR